MISLHTSPLLQPGSGDSGGMNVYVREVASALAQAGVECTTYTRADRPGLPRGAGRAGSPRRPRPGRPVRPAQGGAGRRARRVHRRRARAHRAPAPGVDVVHGNYWLSGVVGHRLKHELDVPLVSTFHTLARVKAEGGDLEPAWRDRAEAEVIGCSDAICVSCPEEERQFRRLYGDPAGRIEIVAAGRRARVLRPGRPARRAARRRAAGRTAGAAVRRAHPAAEGARRRHPRPRRAAATRRRAGHRRRGQRGRRRRRGGARPPRSSPSWASPTGCASSTPQPHHILSSYYRAADVVVVPSRSESFGLVALEAAACGIPVVASAVGGLLNIVHDGVTGLLVDGRDPARYARAIGQLLDDPAGAAAMGAAGGRAGRRLHVELHGRPAAPALHRPRRPPSPELVACS